MFHLTTSTQSPHPPSRSMVNNPFTKKNPPTPAYTISLQQAQGTTKNTKLKGKIQQQEITFPKELGEEHPYNYQLAESAYNKHSFTFGAINKIVDWIWGPGITVKSNNKKAETILKQWLKDVDFQYHGRKWTREAIKKGSGYLELGGEQENETVKGVKNLNASHLYIKRSEKGGITKYTQFRGDLTTYKEADAVTFKPFQIAAFHFNQSDDNAYGLGLIYPNLKKIDDHLSSDEDSHTLIKRKANSPIVATLGDKEREVIPTQGDLDDVASKLSYMNNKTEWAFDDYTRLSTLDFGNVGEKFDLVLAHDEDMLFFGFQMPEVIMGRGNIPEGLAKVQLEAFNRSIKSIQEDLGKVIENQVFRRVLNAQFAAERGLNADIEIVWGLPGQAEKEERIRIVSELLKNPLLGPNLKVSLEEELSKLLALDVKPEPAGEREREEEEEQPPVPGSNAEHYEGTLLFDTEAECC